MAAAGLVSPFSDRRPRRSSASARSRRRLPLILRRIRETADAVVAARPDALVIIDSPDFTHRVARRVRAARAVDPDHQLRVAVGVGLAVRARARHARLCRSRAGDPAVRAGGAPRASAARPASMSAIRWSSALADLRPDARGGASAGAPIRRSCWCCRAAARSEIRRLLAIFGDAIAHGRSARVGADGARAADAAASRRAVRAGVAGWPVRPRIVIEAAEK